MSSYTLLIYEEPLTEHECEQISNILHVESAASAIRGWDFYSQDLLTGESGGGQDDLRNDAIC